MLYDYLQQNYAPNEPILLADIKLKDISMNTLRQQLKRLVDCGKLKRFDTGIYYLPASSIFKSGSMPSLDQVIRCKYLQTDRKVFGYLTGVAFANQLGLTTQVPTNYEIVTNKATTEYKTTKLGRSRIVLRKPRTQVNADNVKALQFLDLMKEIDLLAEAGGEERSACVMEYMRNSKLSFQSLQTFLPLYPDKVYRNLYETGLLHGISA